MLGVHVVGGSNPLVPTISSIRILDCEFPIAQLQFTIRN
jgi:hypothetical protein